MAARDVVNGEALVAVRDAGEAVAGSREEAPLVVQDALDRAVGGGARCLAGFGEEEGGRELYRWAWD